MSAARADFASVDGERDEPAVALVDWSHLVEDFLDNIGVTFEQFCNEMSGGWMFGYLAALRTAGMRPVLFCFSGRVGAPRGFVHKTTGAAIRLLPAPAAYQAIRRRVPNLYADTLEAAAGEARGARRLLLACMKELAPYFATPLVTLARELRRENCKAILCQDYEHARFDSCLLLGKLLRVPVFATFQGGDRSLSRIERLLRSFAVRRCSGLVIASHEEAVRVRSRYCVAEKKIRQIFNPLDFAEWQGGDRAASRRSLGINPGALVAVWHGRVQMQIKGLDVLLDAWQEVCREFAGRDVRLLLVGSGNDRAELRQRIEQSVSKESVMWIDEYVRDRARLRQYLAAGDVYVLASRREGFPVAPVEAMACGLPVVATEVQGIKDILTTSAESSGLIVPREDSRALARAIARVFDNAELRRRLSRDARRRAESCFSVEAVGTALREFLVEGSVRVNRREPAR